MAFLTARLGIYRLDSGEKFFFSPTPGFYRLISQGSTKALNEAMFLLAEHIESPTKPIIEEWKGSVNPLVTENFDWVFYEEPPGLIKYNGQIIVESKLALQTNIHLSCWVEYWPMN